MRRILLSCAVLALSAVIVNGQAPASNKRKLGPAVNTDEYREIQPLISADGQTLYFVREDQGQELMAKMNGQAASALADLERSLSQLDPAMRAQMEASLKDMRAQMRPASGGIGRGFMHQTIWVSHRLPDGSWGPASKLPPPLSDDVATIWVGSVLPDNNTLLVGGMVNGTFADYMQQVGERAAQSGGFFDRLLTPAARPAAAEGTLADKSQVFAWSTRTAHGWSAPAPIRMRGFVHDAERLENMLTPDGRHMIMAIRNREANGEHDLFVSTLGADGVWSKPVNLGANVNSPGRECSPFMAPDARTLYFCSNRPGGRGGFDFYLTRRLDESWQRWSTPENMGPEINTEDNDMNLTVDATGRFAFMAIGPLMKEDLYEFDLPAPLRPRPVAFVWGTVTDPAGAPVPASIAYEFLRNGDGAGQASAKPDDGRYQIALPVGHDYAFRASASGYMAVSDRLDLRAVKDQERIERNLVLVPIEVGRPIRLNNVFFDTAQTTLLPESSRELDRLVTLMHERPALVIEVRGHTDAVDDDAFNARLSEGRAAAVVTYLTTAGVAPARLRSRGYGEAAPVASNATDEGRALNRRVEFVIVSK